jgi:hypothetical protein
MQLDVLADALIREYCHKHSLTQTLSAFDAEKVSPAPALCN